MGIMLAGGIGSKVTEWIQHGSVRSSDMYAFDSSRFHSDLLKPKNSMIVNELTHESYAKTYAG